VFIVDLEEVDNPQDQFERERVVQRHAVDLNLWKQLVSLFREEKGKRLNRIDVE